MDLSPEEQATFNFHMYRVVAKTICECFYESFGYRPYRGPALSAVRTIISLSERYGIPENEKDVVKLVRKVCQEHDLPPLGRN